MDLELTAPPSGHPRQHHRFDRHVCSRPRPVDIRVVPAGVPDAESARVAGDDADLEDAVDAYWTLTNVTMLNDDDPDNDFKAVHESSSSIALLNEELLLDWGISGRFTSTPTQDGKFTEPVHASITFDDLTRPWLLGIPDAEGFNQLNRIRAGNQEGAATCLRKSFSTTSRRQPARRGRGA